jgi:hypothetical protein
VVSRSTPGPVPGLPGLPLVSAGVSDTLCAITATGLLACWGANGGGQASGTPSVCATCASPPVIVQGL